MIVLHILTFFLSRIHVIHYYFWFFFVFLFYISTISIISRSHIYSRVLHNSPPKSVTQWFAPAATHPWDLGHQHCTSPTPAPYIDPTHTIRTGAFIPPECLDPCDLMHSRHYLTIPFLFLLTTFNLYTCALFKVKLLSTILSTEPQHLSALAMPFPTHYTYFHTSHRVSFFSTVSNHLSPVTARKHFISQHICPLPWPCI